MNKVFLGENESEIVVSSNLSLYPILRLKSVISGSSMIHFFGLSQIKNTWVKRPLILVSFLCLTFVLNGCQTMNPLSTRSDKIKSSDITGSLGEEERVSKGDIYVKMSAEYFRQGNLVSALRNNKKALAIDNENGQAHNLMAVIYQRLGDNNLAEQHFKKALMLLNGDSYIHNSYGAFLCQQERYGAADEQFTKALKNPLYRTPEVALTNAGNCAMRQTNYSRAESLLRRSLKFDNKLPRTLVLMSEVMLELKDALSARRYLLRYHRIVGETDKSLWLAVRIAKGLGDRDATAVFTAKLRESFPDSVYIQQL